MRLASQLLLCTLLVWWSDTTGLAQSQARVDRVRLEEFATALEAAKAPGERARLLESKTDLVTVELRRSLINRGNSHLLDGRYALALEFYNVAVEVATRLQDKEGLATAALDIGTVYYFQANYPGAAENYKKARDLFLEIANNYEAAKALSGLALIYKEQRRDTDALAAYQQVLKEFTAMGDKEEMANALSGIGSIYYSQGNYTAATEAFLKSGETSGNANNVLHVADALYLQGDYAQAATYYKQALDTIPERNNPGGIISALTGAANCAYFQGNYDEALQFYEKNFRAQEAQREKLGMAASLRGIGNVHRSRADYGGALENYFKGLELSKEVKAPLGTLLGSIGLVRSLQGNDSLALDYFQKALAEFEANANKIDVARTLGLIGNSYYLLNNYDLALESYRKAFALRESMNDRAGQADLLSGIGTVFVRQKNYVEALKNFQQSLAIYESLNSKEGAAQALTRIADTLIFQADYSNALTTAERAVGLARQANSPGVLWYSLMLVGKANDFLNHPVEALKSINSAIAIVESLRAEPTLIDQADRSGKLAYLAAVDLLVAQNRPAEAFDFAEKAKVQALYELLRRGSSRSTKSISAAEAAQEQKLVGEAMSLQLQIEREAESRTPSAARAATLRQRLTQTKQSYAELRNRLFTLHPQLKTQRGELIALKPEELRALVPDRQTALLEFVVTETRVYLFVIALDETSRVRNPAVSIKAYPLQLSYDQITPLLKQFNESLSWRTEDYSILARQLFDALLLPAADRLQHKTKLTIVPDGQLWRIPFEALQPGAETFVIDAAQVSYAQSLSALREMRRLKSLPRRSPATVGLFGNPTLSDEFTKRVELTYGNQKLTASIEQENEIKRISDAYGKNLSKLFSEATASEENAKAELAKVNLLHFSAPSLIDDTSPLSSFVGLTASDAKQDDGFLQARETLNLQTSARLVVLSKARIKADYNAAGIAGLSWNWFVTGSPALLTSRWETAAGASDLMTVFYTELRPRPRATTPLAVALRRSMLAIRRVEKFKHPHHWATFALIGNAP
jgi:CHAT domain-containing protein/tetratricopeptide (TPR) repeat protein